jgi:hypothetical protein
MFPRDRRHVLFQGLEPSEHRHRAARTAAGDLGAVEALLSSAPPYRGHQRIHLRHRQAAFVAIARVRAVHLAAGRGAPRCAAPTQRGDEPQHALVFPHGVARGTADAIEDVWPDRRGRVAVRAVPLEEFGAFQRFRQVPAPRGEFLARNFRQMLHRRQAIPRTQNVEDALAHEGADAHVAVGRRGHRVAHHGIDADESGALRNRHRGHDRAWSAQDMHELAAPAAGDRDLVHDAARCAHHAVFRDLPQAREARGIQLQAEAGIQRAEHADFHGRRTRDAGIHRHRAQDPHVEPAAQAQAFFLDEREQAAAGVGRPRSQMVFSEQRLHLAVGNGFSADFQPIERKAGFHRQAPRRQRNAADPHPAIPARLHGDEHPGAQGTLANVCAGVIGNPPPGVQARRHPRDPNRAFREEIGQPLRIPGPEPQPALEFRNFNGIRRLRVRFRGFSGLFHAISEDFEAPEWLCGAELERKIA